MVGRWSFKRMLATLQIHIPLLQMTILRTVACTVILQGFIPDSGTPRLDRDQLPDRSGKPRREQAAQPR